MTGEKDGISGRKRGGDERETRAEESDGGEEQESFEKQKGSGEVVAGKDGGMEDEESLLMRKDENFGAERGLQSQEADLGKRPLSLWLFNRAMGEGEVWRRKMDVGSFQDTLFLNKFGGISIGSPTAPINPCCTHRELLPAHLSREPSHTAATFTYTAAVPHTCNSREG